MHVVASPVCVISMAMALIKRLSLRKSSRSTHHDRRNRRHEHDSSSILDVLVRLLRDHELALDIDREDPINLLFLDVWQRFKNARRLHYS